MIRFVHFFNFPAGLTIDEGENWYKREHVPLVKKLPGVTRYRSWRALKVPFPLWSPAPFDQFVRMSELCFEDLGAWRRAIDANPTLWTTAAEGARGFRELEGLLLDEEPQFNLLQHAPQQQYKYMTLPLIWPKGIPKVQETGDLIINVYFFNYQPKVSTVDGEDWYLGHHTREGKQIPGVIHYRTWRSVRAPEEPNLPLQLNRWFRLTELGLTSFEAYRDTMSSEGRIRFTPSPYGNVIGEWRNMFIRPQESEDLLL